MKHINVQPHSQHILVSSMRYTVGVDYCWGTLIRVTTWTVHSYTYVHLVNTFCIDVGMHTRTYAHTHIAIQLRTSIYHTPLKLLSMGFNGEAISVLLGM